MHDRPIVWLLTAATGGRIKQDIQTIDRAGALVQTLGDKQVEIEKASGGVFMRDTARLWNTELEPKLPSQEEARKIADRFIIGNKLLPSNDKYVVAGFSGYSETAISPDSGDATEKTRPSPARQKLTPITRPRTCVTSVSRCTSFTQRRIGRETRKCRCPGLRRNWGHSSFPYVLRDLFHTSCAT